MKYRDLVFDLYGTLVDIHTETDTEAVWEKTAFYLGFYGAGYMPFELKREYDALTACLEMDSGQAYECFPELQMEKVFENLFLKKGISENVKALAINAAQFFRILSTEYLRLYPGVFHALAELKKDGHRLWVLSNAQRVFTAYELRYLGLEGFFEGCYLSSDYGFRKPDKRFFEVLLGERGLRPKDCLMIGNDMTTDIGGAAGAGFGTFYIHSNLSPADGWENRTKADHWIRGADWNLIYRKIQKICL